MTVLQPNQAVVSLVTEAVSRAGLGSLVAAASMTGGQLSDVLAVELASGNHVVAKVYAAQWAWKQAKEVHVLAQWRPLARGMFPEVLWVDPATAETDRAVTLMTRVPGVPLSSVVSSLDDAQSYEIYRELGKVARQLHTVAQPAFGYVVTDVLDPAPSNREYVTRQFAKKTTELERLDGDDGLADTIRRVVALHATALDACTMPVLCHNDLHDGNVLVARDRGRWQVQGVVDVANAVAADPLLDLAKTDYYSIRGNVAKRRGLTDGYGDLGPSSDVRLDLDRLHHALDLYTWFASQGQNAPLSSIRDDLRVNTDALARS